MIMDEVIELRCKSCGGPLSGEGDMLKCLSCGRSQLKVDSQKYIEQAKMEMMAWISKTIPTGMSLNQTETMDPIARHNIFMSSIKPSLEATFREYKFGFISTLSNQLLVMPFKTLKGLPSRYSPKELFEFDAKVKSIKALAVDDDSKRLVNQASGVSTSYAMTVNSVELMAQDQLDRYQFMTNNYKASAEAIADLQGYELVKKRFDALSKACDGINDIMSGNSQAAIMKLEDAAYNLDSVEKDARSNIDYSSMALAVSREAIVCRTTLRIAKALSVSSGLDTQQVFKVISDLMTEVTLENQMQHGNLASFSRIERTSEILNLLSEVISAKSGDGSLKVASGSGSVLFPLWVVEIKYSFVTGSLFKKHSVQVSELIFVSAEFPTSSSTVQNSRQAITDIFKAMPETTFMQRVKGDETSITMGSQVRYVYDDAHHTRLNASTKVVAPTSTKYDVELIVNNYLDACRSTHPKLQMGRATIHGLIYVPAEPNSNGYTLMVNLGNIAPANLGDKETISKLIL